MAGELETSPSESDILRARGAREELATDTQDAVLGFADALRQEPGLTRRQRGWLLAFAKLGYKGKADALVGISRSTVLNWRETVECFPKWEAIAQDVWVEALEQEADRRAFKGTDKPVFGQLAHPDIVEDGKGETKYVKFTGVVGHVREYSDQLAALRLKALAPDRYADRRKTELTGEGGGPLKLMPVADRIEEQFDRLARERALQAAEAKPGE